MNKPEMRMSKSERRKKFNKWIDTDFLHSHTGKTPIPVGANSNEEYWSSEIICSICGKTYGGGIKKSNGEVVCVYCEGKNG
jgi:formylmethanofuran dehydrogenase subunit E